MTEHLSARFAQCIKEARTQSKLLQLGLELIRNILIPQCEILRDIVTNFQQVLGT